MCFGCVVGTGLAVTHGYSALLGSMLAIVPGLLTGWLIADRIRPASIPRSMVAAVQPPWLLARPDWRWVLDLPLPLALASGIEQRERASHLPWDFTWADWGWVAMQAVAVPAMFFALLLLWRGSREAVAPKV